VLYSGHSDGSHEAFAVLGLDRWPIIVLVLLIALVIFGPKRLPELGQALGRAINEFRHATTAVDDEVRSLGSPRPGPAPTTEGDGSGEREGAEVGPAASAPGRSDSAS